MLPATVGITGQQGAQNPTGKDAFQDVGIDKFLKLMIAELQNQDPLNPMDNAQMLQQIGQMRQIASSDKLTETLASVLLGQNVSTAGALIGKTIRGLDSKGEHVTGLVDGISIADGKPVLNVGTSAVDLKNVSDIVENPSLLPQQPDGEQT